MTFAWDLYALGSTGVGTWFAAAAAYKAAAIARNLTANIAGASSTPNVAATVARALLAAILGSSSIANISETLSRSVIAEILEPPTFLMSLNLPPGRSRRVSPAQATRPIFPRRWPGRYLRAWAQHRAFPTSPRPSRGPFGQCDGNVFGSRHFRGLGQVAHGKRGRNILYLRYHCKFGPVDACEHSRDEPYSGFALSILRAVSASISGGSSTPDVAISMQGLRNLTASISATSQTADIAATEARALGANVEGQSADSDIAGSIARALGAEIQGQSTVPDATGGMGTQRSLSASISGTSVDADVLPETARALLANIAAASLAPDVFYGPAIALSAGRCRSERHAGYRREYGQDAFRPGRRAKRHGRHSDRDGAGASGGHRGDERNAGRCDGNTGGDGAILDPDSTSSTPAYQSTSSTPAYQSTSSTLAYESTAC